MKSMANKYQSEWFSIHMWDFHGTVAMGEIFYVDGWWNMYGRHRTASYESVLWSYNYTELNKICNR